MLPCILDGHTRHLNAAGNLQNLRWAGLALFDCRCCGHDLGHGTRLEGIGGVSVAEDLVLIQLLFHVAVRVDGIGAGHGYNLAGLHIQDHHAGGIRLGIVLSLLNLLLDIRLGIQIQRELVGISIHRWVFVADGARDGVSIAADVHRPGSVDSLQASVLG